MHYQPGETVHVVKSIAFSRLPPCCSFLFRVLVWKWGGIVAAFKSISKTDGKTWLLPLLYPLSGRLHFFSNLPVHDRAIFLALVNTRAVKKAFDESLLVY